MDEQTPLSFLLPVAEALRHVRLSADNFTRQTLLAGEGLVADLYCMTEGQGVGIHRHSDTEHLICVLDGRAEVQAGEAKQFLERGGIALIRRDLYHYVRNPEKTPLVFLQISAPKPWDAAFGAPRPVQAAPELPPVAQEG